MASKQIRVPRHLVEAAKLRIVLNDRRGVATSAVTRKIAAATPLVRAPDRAAPVREQLS